MKTMLTWLIVIACIAGLWVAKDYLPKKKTEAVAAAERDVKYATARVVAGEKKVKAADAERDHAHRALVVTDAPLKRDSLAYEFARRHLDTTNVDSLNVQLARANAVIVDQRVKIRALEADTAAKRNAIDERDQLLIDKDDRNASLERLNAGIRAEIPTRGQQLRHDAKVATLTGATLMALKFAFGK